MKRYILKLNKQYVASFRTFSEACEVLENLQRRFKNAKIEIEAL